MLRHFPKGLKRFQPFREMVATWDKNDVKNLYDLHHYRLPIGEISIFLNKPLEDVKLKLMELNLTLTPLKINSKPSYINYLKRVSIDLDKRIKIV